MDRASPARRPPRPGPRRRPRRSQSRWWLPGIGIGVVVLVAVFPVVKRLLVERAVVEATRYAFPLTLEPLPEIDGEALYLEHHARCFEETYTGSWLGKRIDRPAYTQCMDSAYAERLSRVAVLEDPSMSPHEGPHFVRIDYTVRVLEGRLPGRPIERTQKNCEGGGSGGGSGPTSVDLFEKISEGVYRVKSLEGLQARPCRVLLTLDYERWPLSDPLELELPGWDPVAKAAADESHDRLLSNMDTTADCIRAARSGVPRSTWGPVTPALQASVQALATDGINERGDAARALGRMGPDARPAVPAMLDNLLLAERIVVKDIIEALPAVAPDARELAPALHCLLEHPYPEVRTITAVSLTQMEDATGTEALGIIVTTPDERVQLDALTRMFTARAGMKPALAYVGRAASADPSAEVRKRAIQLLPVIDHESPLVEETLQRALEDPDPAVREQADSSLRYLSSLRPGGYNHR